MAEGDFAVSPNVKTQLLQNDGDQNKDLSLETLILLIHTCRLKHLQDKTENELSTLKERQANVSKLHDILKAVNSATNDKGELDTSKHEELMQRLQDAKELGVEIDLDKKQYNRDERDRLAENIRMSVEDLNVENDMQLQTISRLTNERYESYQMARSILKPLHEAKQSAARALRG